MARPCTLLGPGCPRHLCDFLDGGAVPAAAVLRLSPGSHCRFARGPGMDRTRGAGPVDHPDAGDDRGLDSWPDAGVRRRSVDGRLVPRQVGIGDWPECLPGLAWLLR